jgi:hypothetical protein
LALPSAGRGIGRGIPQQHNYNARPSYGRGQSYHVNMNECDAPKSNKTDAGTKLTRSVPITVSG